ncbi:MAG: dihydrodipicolinate reductase [Balneolaceae bacterium]|nr:dihydrodipicolinate reductase [Balneolaceae bacterium]
MVKVVQLGLGPIGQQLTQYLLERPGITILGGVDPDPAKVGKDIAVHAGLAKTGVEIVSGLELVPNIEAADVAVISTLSSLLKVEPQIREAADYGLDIVSTCEELSHPWQTQPECAERIHKYCKEKGVSCLGTGVNPGFLMDYLPSVLTSVCRTVDYVKVERIQDATPRRKPFRDKIGAGLSEVEFIDKRDSIRHVGLEESVRMIADTLNWKLDRVDESLDPVLADRDIKNDRIHIPKGNVAGVQQIGSGFIKDEEVVRLVFKAAVGIRNSHDTISIKGTPGFRSTIDGGINGDIATSAITVNAIRSALSAIPGLKTMSEIQVPAFYSKA